MNNIIKRTSMKHGWFYHYRYDTEKVPEELKNYLEEMFENCPHEFFKTGPRGSSLKFKTEEINPIEARGHEVCELASCGLKTNQERFSTNHSRVQVFMLENDNSTFAMEIPIWIHPEEINHFQKLFNSEEPLTGHIDLLRVENGKIWVWDYKPKANKEKFAHIQTYFYAMMLSKRTGIPLESFMCGYFDESTAYIFPPEEDYINDIKKQKEVQKCLKIN